MTAEIYGHVATITLLSRGLCKSAFKVLKERLQWYTEGGNFKNYHPLSQATWLWWYQWNYRRQSNRFAIIVMLRVYVRWVAAKLNCMLYDSKAKMLEQKQQSWTVKAASRSIFCGQCADWLKFPAIVCGRWFHWSITKNRTWFRGWYTNGNVSTYFWQIIITVLLW